MAVATSFGVLNYSGMLFDTNHSETPIFDALNSQGRKVTNHVKFAVSQEYSSGSASQPSISENDSLKAPEASVTTRTQEYNMTQIFHESTGVSYAKQSNMGTLSGINVAGQEANPQSELDFQVSVKMSKIRKDIEYTLINGVKAEATSDAIANKSAGFLAAAGTIHAVTATPELTPDILDAFLQKYVDGGGSLGDRTILFVSAIQLRQLNKYYSKENGFLLPNSRTVGGMAIDTIITPFGSVGIKYHKMIPNGTVGLFNLGVSSIVEQMVPNKGNFFWEELAKVGAGVTGQIFGQLGLDYAWSKMHGKITGLATTYTDKTYSAAAAAEEVI